MNWLPVSVVIPTYNRATLVGRAISSVLRQCRQGDEVIVVDDGSTDGTEESLAPYRDKIVYIQVPNGGSGRARNIGVRMARNPLLAFLDSDDEWMPGKLDVQRVLMQARPDILFCFSDFAVRSKDGREYRHYLSRWHRSPLSWDEILGPGVPFSSFADLPAGHPDFMVHVGSLYQTLMSAPYCAAWTSMIQKNAAGDALRFAEDLPTFEDWECFGRLARAGSAAYLTCETAWQYGHTGSRLTDADELATSTSRLTILNRVWGSDPAYLAKYKDSFEATVREQRLGKVRALVVRGRTREAREELHMVPAAPLCYRLISLLPGPMARWLLALRRTLRRKQEIDLQDDDSISAVR